MKKAASDDDTTEKDTASSRHITRSGQLTGQRADVWNGDLNIRETVRAMSGPNDIAALRKRKQQMEDELAQVQRQILTLASAEATTTDSVKAEGTTTATTCDCPAPERQHRAGVVPYGSTDSLKESSPLLSEDPPDQIVIGNYYQDHLSHDWEECFSHVRSEEDLENEEIHNESEFYLKSSMFGRGKAWLF